MKSPFKYIKVCAIPQTMGKIMEPYSAENQGIEFESSLVYATPDLLKLCQRIARLNPDAAEIGAGMLASLVEDATLILSKIEFPSN